ncbi:hypothetical protein HK103_002659 [Boothiomyces macroporosus]|uniref:Amino acid transporter transmembrane domain-containing protein n=1 Tax=Boothiomyces macroporosus TaxID=261099 RepID=A0AAD5UMM4_9FUNG|nr:hypothetical protein HK103_002659 [Boothiomyces macroporosus]
MSAQRDRTITTFENLEKLKTLGFVGALAFLFNAATGPGIPFTPAYYQNPGWGFTTICFAITTFVSGFACLFIIEAIQAIPGNENFQGNVEYATLINFYFDPVKHIVGQFLLYGALQATAIQGIVISTQSIDFLLLDIFKKACGFSYQYGWMCVDRSFAGDGASSPFGNEIMIFTVGLFVVFLLVVPLGLTNLDDNVGIQYGSFIFSILMIAQWCQASVTTGIHPENVKHFRPMGSQYPAVIGTIMLNLAVTTVIPSWINIKKRSVNVQEAVWTGLIFIFIVYFLSVAMGFDNIPANSNILVILSANGAPHLLTKFTVYMFSFVMLIPSVPVNIIISRDNLVLNQVLSKRTAFIATFILPWVVSTLLISGIYIQDFQTWTSFLFISPGNFIIPVIIFFQCLKFRKAYNENKELSTKQIQLLKTIHSNSPQILEYLQNLENKKDALHAIDFHSGNGDQSAADQSMELLPKTNPATEYPVDETKLYVGRPNANEIAAPDGAVTSDKVSIHSLDSVHGSFKKRHVMDAVPEPYAEEWKDPIYRVQSTTATFGRYFATLGRGKTTPKDDFEYPADLAPESILNLQTLPKNRLYKSPPFRSVPDWLPIKPEKLAWLVLISTSFVTLMNVMMSIYSLWYPNEN